MVAALSIIFGFMIFMLIISKGRLLFINISSLLVVGAISLGVGYGVATFVFSVGVPILKIIGILVAITLTIILLLSLFGKGSD